MTDTYTNPDYLALLRAILEAPADDTLRLVMADWLEEHGELEYSEFVRVQCALSGMEVCLLTTADHGGDPGGWACGCEWHRLSRRERELLERNATEWLNELPDGFRCGNLTDRPTLTPLAYYRRGFVFAVYCTLAYWAGRLGGRGPSIVQAQPVEVVRLTDTTFAIGRYIASSGGMADDFPQDQAFYSNNLINWARQNPPPGCRALSRVQ